jgi:hypothetical protein
VKRAPGGQYAGLIAEGLFYPPGVRDAEHATPVKIIGHVMHLCDNMSRLHHSGGGHLDTYGALVFFRGWLGLMAGSLEKGVEQAARGFDAYGNVANNGAVTLTPVWAPDRDVPDLKKLEMAVEASVPQLPLNYADTLVEAVDPFEKACHG